jgi:hypothetical protein
MYAPKTYAIKDVAPTHTGPTTEETLVIKRAEYDRVVAGTTATATIKPPVRP